jgi:hypothetical protein
VIRREGLPREELRARLFLRSLLPLLKVVLAARPALSRHFAGVNAVVQFSARGSSEAAYLRFSSASERGAPRASSERALEVVSGEHSEPTLGLRFRDLAGMNDFFAGRPTVPWIAGALRHPILSARVLELLASLRILAPDAVVRTAEDRALRVRLMLYLATHALSQLARAGDPEMTALAEASPDRVYQWTIADTGDGAWLRMCRGRTKAGRGVYSGRRPFVRSTFPTTEAAYRVLTSSGSQMEGVKRGDVVPEGSPEYSRKISILMQRVDELLTGG